MTLDWRPLLAGNTTRIGVPIEGGRPPSRHPPPVRADRLTSLAVPRGTAPSSLHRHPVKYGREDFAVGFRERGTAAFAFSMIHIPVRWRVFLATQACAVICGVLCWCLTGWLGKVLWSAGFLLLLPGNVTVAPAIEDLVWNAHIPLKAVTMIGVVAAILTNALVWWVVLAAIRHLLGRIRFTPARRSAR